MTELFSENFAFGFDILEDMEISLHSDDYMPDRHLPLAVEIGDTFYDERDLKLVTIKSGREIIAAQFITDSNGYELFQVPGFRDDRFYVVNRSGESINIAKG